MSTQISGDTGVSKVQPQSVTQPGLATPVVPLGVGQTWQDVKASRAVGTTYTNTTGRPILVAVSMTATSTTNQATLVIDGVSACHVGLTNGATAPLVGVIPAGSTYVVNVSNMNVLYWSELR